jgi:hypothetical protein
VAGGTQWRAENGLDTVVINNINGER